MSSNLSALNRGQRKIRAISTLRCNADETIGDDMQVVEEILITSSR